MSSHTQFAKFPTTQRMFQRSEDKMGFIIICTILFFSAVNFAAGKSNLKPEEHNIAKRAYQRCYPPEYKCPEAYYCSGHYCQPQWRCSYHGHCPYNYYCARSEGACKKGERFCRSHHECSTGKICLRGKCARKECGADRECKGDDKECVWPGICKAYHQRCHGQYDCKSGEWICVNGSCTKKQCRADNYCKPSEKCEYPGLCKPRPDYCNATSTALCGAGQCCVRPGNYPHGRCRDIRQEGDWCSAGTCPCAEGSFCKRKTENTHWGKCTAEEPGSGSGGSGDFYINY